MPCRPVVVPLLLLAVIAFGVVACRGPGTRARQEASDVYRNARFGFAIRYPSDLRPRAQHPQNDDGVILSNGDGTVTLNAHAAHDVLDCHLATLVERARQRFDGTPDVERGADTASLQGMAEDGRRRRLRFILADGNVYTAILTYPSSRLSAARARDILSSFRVDTARDHNRDRAGQVSIALLDYPAVGDRYTRTSDGPEAGCDRVVLVRHAVPEGAAAGPVATALSTLFSIDAFSVAGWQNFMARTRHTLNLDHVERAGGTARIYLQGRLSGLAGVCDNVRARTQIRRTALAVPGVSRVVLYLNGDVSRLRPRQGQRALNDHT